VKIEDRLACGITIFGKAKPPTVSQKDLLIRPFWPERSVVIHLAKIEFIGCFSNKPGVF
jgi:hypothetical protein